MLNNLCFCIILYLKFKRELKFILNFLYLYEFEVFIFLAVREDRFFGGKYRNKKFRLDEIRVMVSSDGEVLFVSGI